MTRLALALAIVAGLQAGSVLAQRMDPYPSLDVMVYSTLTQSGRAESAIWFPDHADPAQARRGVAVVYEAIPGSAGSVSIAVGQFARGPAGWGLVRRIEGIFGFDPRAPTYEAETLTLTTTTLGPNDARCCPSVPTRWRLHLRTGAVARLP